MTETQRKISKKEVRRQEFMRQKRRRTLLIGIPTVVLIIIVIGLIIVRVFAPDVAGLITFGAQSRTHAQDAEFAEAGLPPTGGAHNPGWQNCGIYDTPLDSSLAVHSLEHGAVWITYHPDLPTKDVAFLQNLVRGESKLLLSPYPNQTADVVMNGWSRQLVVDSATDDRISEFIEQYKGRGPEPGAPCTDGIGAPVN